MKKLKGYSVILTVTFYGINQKILKKNEISVDSNFTFSSYARLCVFHCSTDYCIRSILPTVITIIYVIIALIHTEMISV